MEYKDLSETLSNSFALFCFQMLLYDDAYGQMVGRGFIGSRLWKKHDVVSHYMDSSM